MKIIIVLFIALIFCSCAGQLDYFKELDERDIKIKVLKYQNDSLRQYIDEQSKPFKM